MAGKATQRKARTNGSNSGGTGQGRNQARPKKATRKKTTVKAGSPAKASSTVPAEPRPEIVVTHDQIAERAYHIWEASGHAPGRDYENWVEAERQLQQG
jgi:hypothetical protein